MIKNVAIGRVALERVPLTPPFLLPLISAAEAGEQLEPPLIAIVAELGFDSFMFGMSTSPIVNHESQNYVFTTVPIEWIVRYDEMDYIEIDPRILKTRDSTFPLLWDSRSERGKDERTDAFLDDAAAHGIGSGLAFEFHDNHYVRGLMALSSRDPVISDKRRSEISRRLGDILVLGAYFHEIFRKGVVEQGVAPLSRGARLSARQRECLEMAARGLNTEDIALRLNISARTAQFHFDCIRSKLGAANRQEAVAKGIAEGVIRP
ncbi:MAG TPA: LuxR family transcriptional regulator [Casimicrobiaceae bacterium]|nr:LuxR family transcriptional regulator [Casimicrobiaceae bacterium]